MAIAIYKLFGGGRQPSVQLGDFMHHKSQPIQKSFTMKKIFFFLIILAGLVLASCQQGGKEYDDFAIYLLAEDISGTELSQLDINQLRLQDKPVVSNDDVVSYDRATHTIELTSEAYVRVQQIFPMPVRVDGIPFVVCVGKERIYFGVFMTPASSISYDGIVIGQPLKTNQTTTQIALGYPGQDVFTGNDPRADPRIMRTLEQQSKLK